MVSPDTRIGDVTPVAKFGVPPFDDPHVARNVVIGEPPSNGATKLTRMLASSERTVGCAGALGTVFGTTASDAVDAGPSPSAFDANTVHVYDLPFVKPNTISGDDTPISVPGTPPSDDVQVTVYEVTGGLAVTSVKLTTILASSAATVGAAGWAGTTANAGSAATTSAAPESNTQSSGYASRARRERDERTLRSCDFMNPPCHPTAT